MKIGDKLPAVELLLTNNQQIPLQEYPHDLLLLFFYPKANTPGCTQEGKDFRDLYPQFQSLSCAILGASRDGIKAQQNFKKKYDFPFELIADKSETLCNAFDVIKEKTLFGRLGFGIERSSFLFKQGILIHQWRKVKVKNHAQAVLDIIKTEQTHE